MHLLEVKMQIKNFIKCHSLNCQLIVICLMLDGSCISKETEAFEVNLNRFFKKSEQDVRKQQQHKLIKDCFCNPTYLTQFVDLVIDKKSLSLKEYLFKLNST